MSTIETVWFVTCVVLWGAGVISFQQARYFDGDSDAHSRMGGEDIPIFHTPRHPYALKAKRRGWVLTASAVGLTAAGFIVRAAAS